MARGRVRRVGFKQERKGHRLWALLLPGTLLLTVGTSTWLSFWQRSVLYNERIEATRANLTKVSRAFREGIEGALLTPGRAGLEKKLREVAHATGGRIVLVDPDGRVILEQEGKSSAMFTPLPELVFDRISIDSFRIRMPLFGPGPKRLGECRISAPLPPAPGFPWSTWAGLTTLIGIAQVLLVGFFSRIQGNFGAMMRALRRLGKRGPFAFDEEEFSGLGEMTPTFETCIEDLRERQLLGEESFVEVAIQLSREFELHRSGVTGHGRRTRRYSAWLAERLRLDPSMRDTLEVAALCREIGWLPRGSEEPWGRADSKEQEHPLRGARLFSAFPGFSPVAEILLHQFENWDGSGNPSGLAGENIPLGARVVRIAASFDQLREGTKEEPLSEILNTMEQEAGVLFDPTLFDLFREEVEIRMGEESRPRVSFEASP
jgi:hypothetical protein